MESLGVSAWSGIRVWRSDCRLFPFWPPSRLFLIYKTLCIYTCQHRAPGFVRRVRCPHPPSRLRGPKPCAIHTRSPDTSRDTASGAACPGAARSLDSDNAGRDAHRSHRGPATASDCPAHRSASPGPVPAAPGSAPLRYTTLTATATAGPSRGVHPHAPVPAPPVVCTPRSGHRSETTAVRPEGAPHPPGQISVLGRLPMGQRFCTARVQLGYGPPAAVPGWGTGKRERNAQAGMMWGFSSSAVIETSLIHFFQEM